MSAFDRLPQSYRDLCRRLAAEQPPRILGHRKVQLSPQNRRVRFGVDLHLAASKQFAHRETRQQRRARSR